MVEIPRLHREERGGSATFEKSQEGARKLVLDLGAFHGAAMPGRHLGNAKTAFDN